jgi:hypothetical protein
VRRKHDLVRRLLGHPPVRGGDTGTGPGHLALRRVAATAGIGDRVAAPRARPRDDGHRHRRDVRRRRGGDPGRGGDRRAPRRRVPGQQGAAPSCDPPGHGRGLPCEPAPPRHRPPRPLPAALARAHPARGDPRRVRRPRRVGGGTVLGGEQLRHPGPGRADPPGGWGRARHRPDPVQPVPTPPGVRPPALVSGAPPADHGVLPDRAGADPAPSRSGRGRPPASRHPGPDRRGCCARRTSSRSRVPRCRSMCGRTRRRAS